VHTLGLLASNDVKCSLYMQDSMLDFPLFSRKVSGTRSEPVGVTAPHMKGVQSKYGETHQSTDLLAAIQGNNFTGNSAANSQGGALAVSGNSTSILSSSTFQSNFAARGAGIYIVSSSLTVEATNFTFNAARSAGGVLLHTTTLSLMLACLLTWLPADSAVC